MNQTKYGIYLVKKVFLQRIAILLVGILLLGMAACGTKQAVLLETEDLVTTKEAETSLDVTLTEEDEAKTQTEQSVLCVHICGAVENPGVYELESGSRIYDAVEAAGGFSEDAVCDYVNLALKLEDGWKITIPTQEEVKDLPASIEPENKIQTGVAAEDKSTDNDKVNLNTASKEQLLTLPGIGESRADAILAYREKKGTFSKIEDIMKIEGIKNGMFEKLKDKICVR